MVESANDALRDVFLRHSIGLDRLVASEVEAMGSLLVDAERELATMLRERLRMVSLGAEVGPDTTRAIRRATIESGQILHRYSPMLYEEAEHSLQRIAEYEADFVRDQIEGALPKRAAPFAQIHSVRPEVLHTIVTNTPFQGARLGAYFGKGPRGFGRTVQRQIQQQIERQLATGQGIDQIVRSIERRGVSMPRRHLRAITRTATQHVLGATAEKVYEANSGDNGVVKAIMWLSTLDMRTTLQFCVPRDHALYHPVTKAGLNDRGKRYPYREGPGRIHWGCRSRASPVTKSWKELGIKAKELNRRDRASMDGAMPREMTAEQWMRKQLKGDATVKVRMREGRVVRNGEVIKAGRVRIREIPRARQLERLYGKQRMDMWRRGEITLDQMIDQSGTRMLTLKELGALEGRRAVKKAARKATTQTFHKAREATYGELRKGDVLQMGQSRAKITSNVLDGDKAKITYEMHKADGTIRVSEMTQVASKKTPSPVMPKADTRASYRPKKMSRAEAVEVIKREVPDNAHNGWFRKADKNYKRQLSEVVEGSQEARDAALNVLHRQAEDLAGHPIPFDEFLNTELTLYRGGGPLTQAATDARNTFQSFSLERSVAQEFANKTGGKLYQIKLKPSQTLGSMQTIAEAEVLVPMELALQSQPIGAAAAKGAAKAAAAVTPEKVVQTIKGKAKRLQRGVEKSAQRTLAAEDAKLAAEEALRDSRHLPKILEDEAGLRRNLGKRVVGETPDGIDLAGARKNLDNSLLSTRQAIERTAEDLAEATKAKRYAESMDLREKLYKLRQRERYEVKMVDEYRRAEAYATAEAREQMQPRMLLEAAELDERAAELAAKEADRLDDFFAAQKEVLAAEKAYDKAMKKARVGVWDELPSRSTTRKAPSYRYADAAARTELKQIEDRIDEAMEWLGRYFADADDMPRLDLWADTTGREFHRGLGHASGKVGIHLNRTSPVRTALHEYGHFIENRLAEYLDEAVEHLQRRTVGERSKRLADLFPDRNYKSWEVTKANEFFKPYVGKLYYETRYAATGVPSGAKVLSATEILSMGIEHFYANPLGLLEADPELFEYVVRALMGQPYGGV